MTRWPEGMANTRQVKVESQSGGTPPLSLDHWGEQTVLAICRIPLEPRISTRSYHGSTLQLRTYPFSCWTHVGWQWLTDCLQKTNVLDWQRMRDELVLHTPHCLGRSAEPFAMRHTIQSYGLDALNWALIHQSNFASVQCISFRTECKPETSYNKWHSSEVPFSVPAWCRGALKQSVNQNCHDTTRHGSKQFLFSVSARCWDALTLQQRADLTRRNTLPY